MRQIKITAGPATVIANLHDTPTADAIWAALPIEGRANTWGDEIYFSIPLTLAASADATEAVAVGELGYWPPGRAFCIFFGRTPASQNDEPRAASAVNVFGCVVGDAAVLEQVQDGATVRVEQAV